MAFVSKSLSKTQLRWAVIQKARTSAEFLVKWLNYPDSANSWEPYSSLRDVVVLHDYLKLQKLHRLLNKQHR